MRQTREFKLSSHRKHPHLDFAIVDGNHQQDFEMHRHDFSELFLVTSGKGIHQVADFKYPLQTGDVFVINRKIKHGFKNVKDLKIVNLMFDETNPFFEQPSLRRLAGYQALFKIDPLVRQTSEYLAKLTLNVDELTQAKSLINTIQEEYKSGDIGFEIMISSAMQQLIVLLARSYQLQAGLPTVTLSLGRALIYIDQNYSDPSLTSEKIAHHAYVSKRQLERLFRQFYNTSPNKYLRDIQINHAKEILSSDSKSSIQSVSESCGFTDVNYFSKLFKNKFSITPKKFQKKAA